MYLQGQGAVQTQLDKTWDLISCLNFGLGPASWLTPILAAHGCVRQMRP